MIKIGITGLTDGYEKSFAAHGTSDRHAKRVIFARGVGPAIWPGHVRANNQEIDFEMHTISHQEQHGVFAYTTNCDGYVLLVDSTHYTKEKLDALIANILTFEQKTLQTCPMSIVSIDKNTNKEVQKFAESKGIPYAHVHVTAGIQLPGKPAIVDQSGPVTNVLSALVSQVLPNIGTERLLANPPKFD